MMSGIGHNGGPTMQAGGGFRRVAWTRARRDLMPTLPLEVVRLRVKRAKRLGLPYKTYATIRAVSGHDIVGFLFSSNALGLTRSPQVDATITARLSTLRGAATRLAAVHPPLHPHQVVAMQPDVLEAAMAAPGLRQGWGETRDLLRGFARAQGVPRSGLVVVTRSPLEREWCGAAGFAGQVEATALFEATL